MECWSEEFPEPSLAHIISGMQKGFEKSLEENGLKWVLQNPKTLKSLSFWLQTAW